MNALGQRILDRWDSDPEHDGLSSSMLDRAVARGWITDEDRTARTI